MPTHKNDTVAHISLNREVFYNLTALAKLEHMTTLGLMRKILSQYSDSHRPEPIKVTYVAPKAPNICE